MTPQEIRNLRIKNDYDDMMNMQGDIISWKAIRGTAPYVEEYQITIAVRGIISNTPTYRDKHVVQVILPSRYPDVKPEIRMTSLPNLFHPNWFRDGLWCSGPHWTSSSEGLGYHILRMIRTIQYDAEITDETSPANSDANTWYKSKKNSGLFPCDRTQLPDPTYKGFNIKPAAKKKFEIKN